jgi:acyl-CoA synthetase (AMP-forming)/AMP-acid ligase II
VTKRVWQSPYPPINVDGPPVPDLFLAAAERAPERAAIVDAASGDPVAYGELAERVRRTAAGLAERGLRPGDVLGVLAPNGVEWVEAALGAMAAGIAVTGVSAAATPAEQRAQLETVGARLLSTGGDLPTATGDLPPLELDSTALLPFSSGTTGLPKPVVLTHRNLACAVAQLGAGLRLTGRDVVLGVAPYAHVMGFVVSLAVPLAAGATVVTLPKFGVEALLDAIERRRPTLLIVPPPLLRVIAEAAAEGRDLASLEMVAAGGAPLPPELQHAVAERLPGAAVIQGYGMTETAAPIPIPDRAGTPPGSPGRLAPNTELRVVDPDTGADLGPDERGELLVRGPQNTPGYLDRPDATAQLIDADGWLHTGDVGWVDPDGFLHVVDRLKSLIKVNALQVAPAELEALLTTHPAVADAAVIARPDARAGEVPVAVVVPRAELDPEELIDWVAARVARHKRIRAVRLAKQIPRTPSGKILHRALVAEDRQPVADDRQPVA